MAKIGGYEIRVAGLWWCRQEDYSALLDIFEDSDGLPRTWEEWLQRSEIAERRFQDDGHIVERVYLDVDTFGSWCRQKGKRINSQARIEYASWVAAQKHKSTH